MGGQYSNVIHVDFESRRRRSDVLAHASASEILPEALSAVRSGNEFVVFWRPPGRNGRGEYLGGRFDRGWMLFVWTGDDPASRPWRPSIEARGYVPQRLDRRGFKELITQSDKVGGLIVNGDIDVHIKTIRAAAEQITHRADALRLLG